MKEAEKYTNRYTKNLNGEDIKWKDSQYFYTWANAMANG